MRSQYDALLAGNLHPAYPVDRRVMFSRCRGWLVNRGYSMEINDHCLKGFQVAPSGDVLWHFDVPAGMGRHVPLDIRLRLAPRDNAVALELVRPPARPGREDRKMTTRSS